MEFVKPKPGPVENLFLISGLHQWFLSPVGGGGPPWSCSQLSTLAAYPGQWVEDPRFPTVEAKSGLPGRL